MRNRSANSESNGPAAPACWQREAPSPCLRVELPNGNTHLFAYQHFLAATLTRSGEGAEILRVTFSTHELDIEGRGLRDLLLDLQDLSVKWLRPTPERYHALAANADGIITAIGIQAVE